MMKRDECFRVLARHVTDEVIVSTYSSAGSKAMSKGRTVVNKDSRTDQRTRELYKKVYARSKERAYVAVPMLRDGRWVASLWCSDDKPRDWTAAEVTLIESIAERTWAAVERVRNEQALQGATAKFESVFNQSGIFAAILDLDGTVDNAHQASRIPVRQRAEGREPDLQESAAWTVPIHQVQFVGGIPFGV